MGNQSTTAFKWFSWEKALIWGLFLLLVYVLRHFFFIIFMTFITAYVMRNLILFLASLISPNERNTTLEQTLTVICFLLLLAAIYGLGRYFVPQLVYQGQELVKKVGSLEESPQGRVDSILRGTVGYWLFSQEYGEPENERYRAAFDEYNKEAGPLAREYDEFGKLYTQLQNKNKNPSPNSKRPEENFKRYLPKSLSYLTYLDFVTLAKSYPFEIDAFSGAFRQLIFPKMTPEEQLSITRANFRYAQSKKLVDTWKEGPMAEKLSHEADRMLIDFVGRVGNYLGSLVPILLTFPIQFTLSLMLSFFITFDIPRLARGVRRLKASRMAQIYKEIAPGLVNFGKLIGRSFQAQGVIAFINTILTLCVIKILGIENELFLSAIVFICSFIPVLGVVLSALPIAVMAIIQDDGGFMLAVWAVLGILIVHFIETSYLNPKIVGTFLHLHPVLVLTILAVGEHFFGIWGLLLGCPVMVYVIRFVILNEGLPWEKEPVQV